MNWIDNKTEGQRVCDARLHYANWLEQIKQGVKVPCPKMITPMKDEVFVQVMVRATSSDVDRICDFIGREGIVAWVVE
jgi:hypothetical protein